MIYQLDAFTFRQNNDRLNTRKKYQMEERKLKFNQDSLALYVTIAVGMTLLIGVGWIGKSYLDGKTVFNNSTIKEKISNSHTYNIASSSFLSPMGINDDLFSEEKVETKTPDDELENETAVFEEKIGNEEEEQYYYPTNEQESTWNYQPTPEASYNSYPSEKDNDPESNSTDSFDEKTVQSSPENSSSDSTDKEEEDGKEDIPTEDLDDSTNPTEQEPEESPNENPDNPENPEDPNQGTEDPQIPEDQDPKKEPKNNKQTNHKKSNGSDQ
ncbi:hypothetical protein [Gracilibacillus dipsosauri]|uniref:hypothetical protein n=1 Tax=Gracilibacillus dipsosauri TaxID=178340 RepID=UPI00240A94D5